MINKAAVLMLLSVSISTADSIPPPEVFSETLSEYLDGDLAQWKILHSMYSEALEKEANRLADEISVLLQISPSSATLFMDTHRLFMEYASAQAVYSEEVQWVDLNTGEAYWGTGYGDTELSILCSLHWERILYYRRVLSAVSQGDSFNHVFQTLPDSAIGGF